MHTNRLFRENVYLRECDASIRSVSTREDKVLITLDQTIFFPTGGGQSCDLGTINDFAVVDVYEYEDDIFHCVACAPDALRVGDSVHLTLDWARRFDNMQRHCGEHILSGMFYREYGGVNRGFHMGDNYMTVDISLEENPDFRALTWEMAKHAELCTNEAIWSNAPVITRHFDTKQEAEHLPLRKALAIEEDITIVCVGDVENPSDCVACCGTHPSTAGQVGLLKIFKVEPNKGMFRVYFEAGRRAFLKYQEEMDVLTALCNKLSAGTEDVLAKYESAQEKNRESRTQLHLLKKKSSPKRPLRFLAKSSKTMSRTHCFRLVVTTVCSRWMTSPPSRVRSARTSKRSLSWCTIRAIRSSLFRTARLTAGSSSRRTLRSTTAKAAATQVSPARSSPKTSTLLPL